MIKDIIKNKYRIILSIYMIVLLQLSLNVIGKSKDIGFVFQLQDSWVIILLLMILMFISLYVLEEKYFSMFSLAWSIFLFPILLDIISEKIVIAWIIELVIASIVYFIINKQYRNIKYLLKFLCITFGFGLLIGIISVIGLLIQVFIIGIALPT